MFERFASSCPARPETSNFGLGLSIVRAITEAHGGRVTAGPGPLGSAAVSLWLPLYHPAPQPVAVGETSGAIPPPHQL